MRLHKKQHPRPLEGIDVFSPLLPNNVKLHETYFVPDTEIQSDNCLWGWGVYALGI